MAGTASESKTDETLGVVYCDLDGVIWRGHAPIAGAAQAVADLRSAGWRVLFVTNNSFSLLGDQEAKLDSMGIPAVGDVVTSAQSAATLVQPGETVLNCGGPGITEALVARGAVVVDVRNAVGDAAFRHNSIDAVIVGFHRDFCFDFLSTGLTCVQRGARLIGTNDDATFPTAEGELPGGGSLLASFVYATSVAPAVAGKPHGPMAALVRQAAQVTPLTRQVMVGDRPSTDGAFAHELKIPYAQVWSGVLAPCSGPVDGIDFALTGNDIGDIARQLLVTPL